MNNRTNTGRVSGDLPRYAEQMSPEQIGVNLRAHGCPEHLASRVVASAEIRAGRTSATSSAPATVSEAIALLRRATQLSAKGILATQSRDMSAEDFASLGGHMMLAHELCEAACSMSATVRDMLDSEDFDDDLNQNSLGKSAYRAFRDSHKKAHQALEEACVRCATNRLDHTEAAKALGK